MDEKIKNVTRIFKATKQKTAVAILTCCLIVCLTACGFADSLPTLKSKATTTTTTATTVPTTSVFTSSYQPGIFTEENYASEWLNLRLDVPSTMSAVDIQTLQKRNDTQKALNPDNYSWVEMLIQAKEGALTTVALIQVSLTVVPYENNGLKALADQAIQQFETEIKEAGGNGVEVKPTLSPAEHYVFFGEEYYAYEFQLKTYYNSSLTNTSGGWILYRLKEDRLISIMSNKSDFGDATPHDIMAYFDTYYPSADSPTPTDTPVVTIPTTVPYIPPSTPSYTPSVPYTIRLDASTAIYGGPGYQYDYVGAVGQSTKYTIVEERYDNGLCWGRLKSGLGWVLLNDNQSAYPDNYLVDTNYTIRLDSWTEIYSGPGYQYACVGTVGQSTTYTIVEECYSYGLCWGRLKSGLGWVNLT